MKVLNTLRKQKLLTQNAHKAYLVYTMHRNTDKYQWKSERVCISDPNKIKQSTARKNITMTKQSKVLTITHGRLKVMDRLSNTIHKAISRRKLRRNDKASI